MKRKIKARNILFFILILGIIFIVHSKLMGNIKLVWWLSILSVYILLLIYPMPLAGREKQRLGRDMPKNGQSDYLLVISSDYISSSERRRSFLANDWSYAWANTLFQEIGHFTICQPEQLFQSIEDKRMIVISKSAVSLITQPIKQKIAEYVEQGGVILLEQPDNQWTSISGITFGDETRRPGKITYINEKYLTDPYNKHLLQLPLNTYLNIAQGQTEDVEVVLSMDDLPALCLRVLGSGAVLTINFNYGLELVSIQQGRPTSDDFVLNKDLLQTQDLVLEERLKDNAVPYADLLERFIFKLVDYINPTFRWWYFPQGYAGACIVTHDCEAMGDELVKTAQTEKELEVSSTFFLIWNSPISTEAIKKIKSLGIDVQMHWNRNFQRRLGWHPLFFLKRIPLPFLQRIYYFLDNYRILPLKREVSFVEQGGYLNEKSQAKMRLSRLHTLKWGKEYTDPFRVMNYYGLQADSSYGPNHKAKGYLFGTGLPFYPLDTNGLLIPVLELPFQAQDVRAEANISFLKRLFTESQNIFHQAIVTNYHPDKFHSHSEIEQQWRQTFTIAQDCQHWIANMSEFLDFFQSRSRSIIRTRKANGFLQVDVQAYCEKLSLFFPKAHIDLEAQGLLLDGRRVGFNLFEHFGEEVIMVEIPQGGHRLEIMLLKEARLNEIKSGSR